MSLAALESTALHASALEPLRLSVLGWVQDRRDREAARGRRRRARSGVRGRVQPADGHMVMAICPQMAEPTTETQQLCLGLDTTSGRWPDRARAGWTDHDLDVQADPPSDLSSQPCPVETQAPEQPTDFVGELQRLWEATCTVVGLLPWGHASPRRRVHAALQRIKATSFEEQVQLLQRAARSSFLAGGGSRGWRLGPDAFFREDIQTKLAEGLYDDPRRGPSRSPDHSVGAAPPEPEGCCADASDACRGRLWESWGELRCSIHVLENAERRKMEATG